jgi:hypothetical protein
MEEPPLGIKSRATSAPTDRRNSRYGGVAPLDSEAVFLSSFSLLETYQGTIIEWTQFLAHERLVINRLQHVYLRIFFMLPIGFAASNETR